MAFAGHASAEIIDDIVLTPGANGEVDAVIKFSVPIQYIRHFPQGKSPFVAIYFNILQSVPRDEWQNYESHRSPPSDLIVGFTTTTRDLSTGPRIDVRFNRPAQFEVSAGKSGNSIVLHIKPDLKKPDQQGTPQAALPPVGAGALAAAGAGVAAGAAAAAAAPAVPAAALAARAPAPAAAPAPAMAAPQVGGAGLPPFPAVEAPPPGASAALPENASLADRVKLADSQAAALMITAGNALAAGQFFAAIDAFNGVLKLPPNKYSPDAQVWIGITRDRAGQIAKAELEYQLYLKLYPDGAQAPWVRQRLAKLTRILPAPSAPPAPVAVQAQPTGFQTTEYGSLSMYYYRGASQTTTVSTIGNVTTPTTLTAIDQSALVTNVSATLRSYNNAYDNRLVFQDLYARDFLHMNQSRNRLNAAFYEVKSREDNYSVRAGRQSAMGGGVLGRFGGLSAGYGFSPNWRINAVGGVLSDYTLGTKPVFVGTGLDFGIRDPLGGSVYVINQTVKGYLDRRAVGGTLRYFEPSETLLAMLDYDVQFKQMNIATLQGTLNTDAGIDYNFLIDHRMMPSLSIRNAVNGTVASIDTLRANGWTQQDLIALAKLRTGISNTAQVGLNARLSERWQFGSDVVVANQSALPASGTLNPDFTTGIEGFVPATPATGNSWTFTERLVGNDLITPHDISIVSVSYTKSKLLSGETFLVNNHANIGELWALDTTLRLYWQLDNLGDRTTIVSPTLKFGYHVRKSLTLETEGGLEWTNNKPVVFASSRTLRQYIALGFRWDF